jgi:hypothetical protein
MTDIKLYSQPCTPKHNRTYYPFIKYKTESEILSEMGSFDLDYDQKEHINNISNMYSVSEIEH